MTDFDSKTNLGDPTSPRRPDPAYAYWWNDGAHMSHTTRHCRKWGTIQRHTSRDTWARTTRTPNPEAWVCTHCAPWWDQHNTPEDSDMGSPSSGCGQCEACGYFRPITKFPTTKVSGVGQVRDHRICRDCRKAGATSGHQEIGWDMGDDRADPWHPLSTCPDAAAVRSLRSVAPGTPGGWARVARGHDTISTRTVDGWAAPVWPEHLADTG